jgi:hypothetical protein
MLYLEGNMEIALYAALGTSALVALFMVAFGIFIGVTFPLETPPGEA